MTSVEAARIIGAPVVSSGIKPVPGPTDAENAAAERTMQGRLECLRLLLAAGFDPSDPQTANGGRTAVHMWTLRDWVPRLVTREEL